MFREESLWIKSAIQKLKPEAGNDEVANIGSSTDHFRRIIQPHIHQNIINTLLATGWKIVNVDLKREKGVDVVGDITKVTFSEPLKDRFSLTICTNLLEHVEDIKLVAKNLVDITRNGGYLLITVPYRYQIHLDPIDNGFRPTPQQIIDLFSDVAESIIDSKIISITDKDQYRIRKSRFPLWGYRERLSYYLGKRHKTSAILFSITK